MSFEETGRRPRLRDVNCPLVTSFGRIARRDFSQVVTKLRSQREEK